jgi:hypothetical protein
VSHAVVVEATWVIPCQIEQLLSTMSSPIFMIFILQVDIHEVKVFPKFQFSILTKSLDIN